MANVKVMLDTNTVSYIVKGKPISVRERLREVPMSQICISAITEAELLHGIAKNPKAKHLPIAVREFLLRVDILPWDSAVAKSYAQLRATCEASGKTLGTMDMLIAAHAIAVDATLVSSDKAFSRVGNAFRLTDWAL